MDQPIFTIESINLWAHNLSDEGLSDILNQKEEMARKLIIETLISLVFDLKIHNPVDVYNSNLGQLMKSYGSHMFQMGCLFSSLNQPQPDPIFFKKILNEIYQDHHQNLEIPHPSVSMIVALQQGIYLNTPSLTKQFFSEDMLHFWEDLILPPAKSSLASYLEGFILHPDPNRYLFVDMFVSFFAPKDKTLVLDLMKSPVCSEFLVERSPSYQQALTEALSSFGPPSPISFQKTQTLINSLSLKKYPKTHQFLSAHLLAQELKFALPEKPSKSPSKM